MRIHPLKALRPAADRTADVASVPYDVVNTEEARQLAAGNDASFLHIIRPDIDLPDGTDPYDDAVYEKARENFVRARESGVLVEDADPALYLYRQIMNGHAQRGLVAGCHIDDYESRILTHEKTRPAKEDDRVRHMATLRAHTGPVFMAYRDQAEIDSLLADVESSDPMFDFTAEDGVRHTGWQITGTDALVEAFEAVPVFYIADGHHRSAGAARVGRECREAGTASDESEWFLSVLFPASQLNILAYNRVVHDLNGMNRDEFLAAIETAMPVEKSGRAVPESAGEISMFLDGDWYTLTATADADADPVSALDVSILQERVLAPVLGIEDVRTSPRIEFVGGIRGTEDLERRVNDGDAAVAFSMYPTLMNQLMAVADDGRDMPPKSTWFEPKLRSGLFVHEF